MQLPGSPRRRRNRRREALVGAAPLVIALATLMSTAPAWGQTLDRIRDTGKLRVGYRADAKPFSFEDGSSGPAGYSVELCRRVAKDIQAALSIRKLEIEAVLVGNHERFLAVKQGRIDLLCGASTVTLRRREDVSFSIPVFLGGIAALVRKDAPPRLRAALAGQEPQFRSREALGQGLEGRTITVRLGTTAETWVDEKLQSLGVSATVAPVGLHGDAIQAIAAGDAEVLFGDRAILLDELQRSPRGADLSVLCRYFTYEAISLALERGDEDFRLLIDRTLSRLYRSGEITEIFTSFFGEPSEVMLGLFSRAALPE